LRAVRIVTVGMFALLVPWYALGFVLDDPPVVPPALWVAAVLIAPAALAVYWRPAYRVPDGLFLTAMSAVLLGMGGAGWGSRVAPAIGALTLLAMVFVPRARAGRDRSTLAGPDGR
jgi:hypothetical protein